MNLRPWRLDFLVLVTIACAFVADLALRLVPLDRFTFRAWEAVRTPGEDAPFLANHRYHSDRTYGNLAAIGNLPALRQYRSVTFTTDALGYPNPPGLATGGRVQAILFGSSFAAGSELGDQATLSAQLSAITRRSVYNAAEEEANFAEIRTLARRLVRPGGLVIFEFPETREAPPITPLHDRNQADRCRVALAALHLPQACRLVLWVGRHARVSPLQILCQRALKAVQDGRWLPNPYARLVLVERLRNGEATLLLAEERTRFRQARSESQAARYFVWLAHKLERENFTLLVLLVPQKYTVYQPLLVPPEPGPDESVGYLDRLERRLQAAGVPVVNLTASLRAAAAAALERGADIYFPDDTHWDSAGVSLAAAEISRVWGGVPGFRHAAPSAKLPRPATLVPWGVSDRVKP